MNQVILYLKGLDRKVLILTLGGILLLLNIARLSAGFYTDQISEMNDKLNLLSQYQETVYQLPALEKKIEQLKQKATVVENYLFKGRSEEEVSSSMQIMLQELVTKVGLEPESIRPIASGVGKNGSKNFHEISIKLRLSGSQNQFIDFIAALYRSDKYFQVESFILKPYKNSDMKIFIDLKGFYALDNV